MLAQTCSQIGVDSGPAKLLSSSSGSSGSSADKLKSEEKSKKIDVSSLSSVSSEHDKVSFKPYRSSESSERVSPVSASSSSPVAISSFSDHPSHPSHSSQQKTKEVSKSNQSETGKAAGGSGQKSSNSPSPIIQSGLDLLTSKPKLSTLPTTSSSYDPTNPAFRPPGLEVGCSSYLSAHAAVCKDPNCRDPTCPTANASYNAYLARLNLSQGLPPGYLELMESYKMYSAAAMRLPGAPAPPPPALSSPESQLAAYSQLLGAGALRAPGYPSALTSMASSRYSPYPKPGYPSPLPASLAGVGGPAPPLPQLPPHLSSLGAMTATNQMALYSLLGGRL